MDLQEDPMTPLVQPVGSPHRPLADAGLAVLLVVGYASPVLAALSAALGMIAAGSGLLLLLVGLCALASAVALAVRVYRHIRRHGRGWLQGAAEALVLVILPAWGLFYNHYLGEAQCRVTSCAVGNTAFRPLAEPEVLPLLALHAVTALAYAASRRRPAALHPPAELLVHALLLVGIAMHAVVAVQFGPWLLAGLAFPPVFIPCLMPALAILFYGAELRARLRRRGAEAQARTLPRGAESVYREGPPQEAPPPEPAVHRPTLARALALSPALLGLYAVAHAAWLGRADGALRVFTRTCEHTLSQVPLEVIPADCHYLCTVAARGHSWLVRPLRMGRRGGKPIVVNRQLAVANAFEDLLHERWPRFGRLARRIYDRVGLPVSRYLRPRWASDLVYLAMKPAEWIFYTALVLLDPGAPESRIDRMYR